ncbi:MAG: F0F1 ATP synthase subunit A [Alphaproteobacteria bacterium GM202ARS2]|nr:F0F1 ATP synthase subunit A [Alphaproteobacteria bacterium GM202ARS2]
MATPLDQFAISTIGPVVTVEGFPLALTNSALAMLASCALLMVLVRMALRRPALVPNHSQSIAEQVYLFVAQMVEDNAGTKAKPYFPLILTLFMLILFGNMLGMVPGSFTFTSHISVTFALASFVFLFVTAVGFYKHGLRFLSLFIPKGVPILMLPLMIVIELISYLSRPISLALRLFANMMAGHIMLKVFAGFVFTLGAAGVFPLIINVALTGFEFLIAFLQAYVFAVLSCLYLSDALNLH